MLKFIPQPKIKRIVSLLLDGGASDCILVGGFVRDLFLGLPSKDVDIEVYGLTYERILQILGRHFSVNFVGQSFGTVKIGGGIDISIPRVELKSGAGHKGFEVLFDPYLDLYSAFSRRDFTINAIGIRIDNSIYDPFDGRGDIVRKILRAPTAAFCEDPLRVLRGMQFAARFGFKMEPQTVELCMRVFNEFNSLSTERVWCEWSKWAAKGIEPSRGLFLLQETGWIKHFPEIDNLIIVTKNQSQNRNYNNKIEPNKIEQNEIDPNENAEKNVVENTDENPFVNTARVCDCAVKVADEFNFAEEDRLTLIFAALCYNLDKSCNIADNNDELSYQELSNSVSNLNASPNLNSDLNLNSKLRLKTISNLRLLKLSSSSACEFVRKFLGRINPPMRIVDCVLSIVGEVLTREFVLGGCEVSDVELRRLSARLEPSNIRIWLALCRALIEAGGGNDKILRQVDECELRAKKLNIIDAKPKPILQGRNLIKCGVNAGREMGIILENAYEAQLDGDINNIDEAMIWYSKNYVTVHENLND
ncbi:MAG: hypothetical protein LBP59_09040 [Planctomycetaceae bacterium]|jgi:tRNA nucleotidyltransferase (CCA-adding enzyme)|nr:hypothetical protein [Planctomycetaceae bacterium]